VLWSIVFGTLATAAQVGLALHMWLTFVISAAFLVGYILRRRRVVLAAALAWFVEGAWEYFLRAVMSPSSYADYNIRLELLIVVPAVIGLSAAAGHAIFSRRRRKVAETLG
jgi:hypothetical protein